MYEALVVSIQPPFPVEITPEEHRFVIDRGLELFSDALTLSPKYILLPEYFNTFGLDRDRIYKEADNWENFLDKIISIVKSSSSYIILPMIVNVDGNYYNRAIVINRNKVVGWYDKTHLTIIEREKLGLTAGNELKYFDTEFGRITIAICYEIYFPELFVKLWEFGPDIIFHPSLQRSEHEPSNEAILKTRAMDTQSYIVRSSFGQRIGRFWEKSKMFGGSCILHPDGTILANAGHYEGLAIAKVVLPVRWIKKRSAEADPAPVREYLREDRRPDLYK